jgi:hypothetical protein
MRITITGPPEVPEAAERWQVLFEWYVGPFAHSGHDFFVGGGAGIDTLALQWLVMHRAPVTVVVPATVEDQPDEARERIRETERAVLAEVVELRHPEFPDAAAYQARDRYMVDRSSLVIGYAPPDGDSEAAWSALEYAASKGIPRLIVPAGTNAATGRTGPSR